MTKPTTTATTLAEQKAIELRREGLSIAKIVAATGLAERHVKALTAGVPKGKKSAEKVTKIRTPLSNATERIFPLATRKIGIRDYELKNILHEEYGATWDTSANCYKSNFCSDTIARVKNKVRKLALDAGCNAIFVMDWIDDCAPRSSSSFLISAATDLLSRIDVYLTEYMATYATWQGDESEAAQLARKKQYYAAQQHLLKLAITGYHPEPVERLLERTANLVGELEGNPDIRIPKTAKDKNNNKPNYYPEPSSNDPFLNYAESQAWI